MRQIVCSSLFLLSAVVAQDAGSSFGHARTREAAALGKLPTPLEVAVADIVNYHRHRLPLPRADQRVMLDVRVGRRTVAPGDEVVVQFGYTTAPGDDRADLPPLNLALVIDRSGSMEEAGKMRQVKAALTAFVARLRPSDRVALVTYDSEARLDAASREVRDGRWLRDAIARLEPGGATNLHGGLMLGLREVAAGAAVTTSNRVLLLTDGIANRGETDAERILAAASEFTSEGEIDLSTIGVGRNLDVGLLDRLARGGRGLFHYVADSADVQKVFVDEHEALVAPVARRVDLRFALPEGLRLERVIGHDFEGQDGRYRVALPNLNRGATGVVLAVCRAVEPLGRFDRRHARSGAVQATLTYRSGGSTEDVAGLDDVRFAGRGDPALADPEIRKNYTIARLAEGMHEMARHAGRRQWAAADRELQDALAFAREHFATDDDADVARVRAMALDYSRVLRRYVDRFRDL